MSEAMEEEAGSPSTVGVGGVCRFSEGRRSLRPLRTTINQTDRILAGID